MESSATFGATAHEKPSEKKTLTINYLPFGWRAMTWLMTANFILWLFAFAWLIPQFTTMKVSTTGAFSSFFWWIFFISVSGFCLLCAVASLVGRFWQGSWFGYDEENKHKHSAHFDKNARIYLSDMFIYHFGITGFAALLMFGISYFLYTDCVSGSVDFGAHINPGPVYVSGEVMCVARTYSFLIVTIFSAGLIVLDIMKFRFLLMRSLMGYVGSMSSYKRYFPFGDSAPKGNSAQKKSATTVKFNSPRWN